MPFQMLSKRVEAELILAFLENQLQKQSRLISSLMLMCCVATETILMLPLFLLRKNGVRHFNLVQNLIKTPIWVDMDY